MPCQHLTHLWTFKFLCLKLKGIEIESDKEQTSVRLMKRTSI